MNILTEPVVVTRLDVVVMYLSLIYLLYMAKRSLKGGQK